MRKSLSVIAIAVFCGYSVQGICRPTPSHIPVKPVSLPIMPSLLIWHKVHLLHSGMTPEQAMNAGPFLPMRPKSGERKGWCTLLFCGPLTAEETKKLNGKEIAVDVQVVMHAGPVSASNPPNGSLYPARPASTETIATVSAPYLSDGGAICLD